MSDHEADNAGDWVEAELATVTATHSAHPDSLIDAIPPKPRQQAGRFVPRVNGNDSPRGLRRGKPVGIAERAGVIHERLDHIGKVENAAFKSFLRGEKSSGNHTFHMSWKELQGDVHAEGARASARQVLDSISCESDSYVATPPDRSNEVFIWGSQASVVRACALLEAFEISLRKRRLEGKKDLESWAPISAVDARRDQRNERRARALEIAREQQNLASAAGFAYEFWLLWPHEYLDFERVGRSAIESLETKFLCAIYYDQTTSFVRVMANGEENLLTAVTRIVNMAKEMVAEDNDRIKATMVQLPQQVVEDATVSLHKSDTSSLAIPVLDVGLISCEEVEGLDIQSRNRRRGIRREIAKAFEKHIRTLRLPQKHLRLRVNFGKIALARYQRPTEGREDYNFDYFCEMLQNERTEVDLQGFLDRGKAHDISKRLAETKMLTEHGDSFTVLFDFQQDMNTLRLECEFRPAHDPKELEMSQQRWTEMRPGDLDKVLQLNVLDFEKVDWQFLMTATTLNDNKRIGPQLTRFQQSIGFRAESGIGQAPSRRRVTFALGNRQLSRVTELTTKRYRFKNTDGIFEITRRDDYPEVPGHSRPNPESTTWSASYYYPEWDNLLGEYAYLEPGQQVSWQPYLQTFFPDEKTDPKSGGFKNFIKEVEELQKILLREMTTGVDLILKD